MRILYLMTHNPTLSSGVQQKINTQVEEWKRQGHIVVSEDLFDNGTIMLQSVKLLHLPIVNFRYVRKLLRCHKPEVIYMRYGTYRIGLCKSLNGYRVVVEFNSLIDRERGFSFGIALSLKRIYHALTVRLWRRITNACVGVTPQIANYGALKMQLPLDCVAAIPNSIILPKPGDQRKRLSPPYMPVKLIMVGSPEHEWNGIDIIESAVHTLNGQVSLTVVGSVRAGRKAPNVVYLGRVKIDELKDILVDHHVALGPMARSRSGLYANAALKTRLYLSLGLPVIAGQPDVAIPADRLWFRVISPITTESVFAEQLLSNAKELQSTVVPLSEVNGLIDVETIESKRLRFLQYVVDNFSIM